MNARLLGGIRLLLGLLWLYQGLWLKLISVSPQHLAVVGNIAPAVAIPPRELLAAIGLGETLLGLGALSGWCARFVAWFQIGLVVAMNAIGLLAAGSAIADPAGLLAANLPFIACALVVAIHGPGAWVLKRPPRS